MIVLKRKVNRCKSIEDVYKKIGNMLEEEGAVSNGKNLMNDLIERQNMGPIQIQEDFYLPHIRTEEVSEPVVVNVDGFGDNKVLFILVPETDFDIHKEFVVKIIIKLDEKEFMENMGYSEELFREYIISIITED